MVRGGYPERAEAEENADGRLLLTLRVRGTNGVVTRPDPSV
jgi:hypothetical protein